MKVIYFGPCDVLFRLMMGSAVSEYEFLADESWWTAEQIHTAPLERLAG